eukprot:MONOS_4224.1-p1 / transcript=MONOS_4224.1 / gene=MONOS_4224 / organism=Monocercomonoides_exilis_PA203 / gene_product=phospholipase A-2-activating protein, putative / transcript_product=phospholipase A-2-activating protein, putative / location=Mono_scaffold00110:201-1965(-) / protein_length=322 / sequence_SO=supercontig / SO=protein_coding / is_pseudo=false
MDYKLSYENEGAHESIVRAVCVISDNAFLTGGYDKQAKLWKRKAPNSREFECTRTFIGHTGDVFGVCYIPPNKNYENGAIATTSGDSSMVIWNEETGSPIHICMGHKALVSCVCYSPTDETILTGSWDSTIRRWAGDACTEVLNYHKGNVQSITMIGTDGTFASCSSDSSIAIWKNSVVVQKLATHTQPVRSVFSLPDLSLISCGNDGMIIHWTGTAQYMPKEMIQGSYSLLFGVNCLSDGRVISGGEDRMLTFWSLDKLEKQGEIAHPSPINQLSVFPNGDIVTVSDDHSFRIWSKNAERIAPDEVLAAYEERLTEFVTVS